MSVSVDIHAHTIPADLLVGVGEGSEVLAPRIEVVGDVEKLRLKGGILTPALADGLVEEDLSTRVAWMDSCGLDRQVLSPWVSISASFVDDDASPEYARLVNESLVNLARRHQDRFHLIGTLPLADPEQAAVELRHAVTTLGMIGAQLPAMVPVDVAAEWAPLWTTAEELSAILVFHPVALAMENEPYLLGALVGNPAETTVAVARLMMSGTLERFPSLRIVLVHGGGFLPYQAGRLEQGFKVYGDRFGSRLAEPPLLQLRRIYYDSLLHSPLMTRALVDVVGVDHVLLGTDHPFALGDLDPLMSIDRVEGLSEADKRMIHGGNFERMARSVLDMTGKRLTS